MKNKLLRNARFLFLCLLSYFAVCVVPNRPALADNKQMASCYSVDVRSCDEIWLISTARLNPDNFDATDFCVEQLVQSDWQSRTVCDLVADQEDMNALATQSPHHKPMIMYLHGNRLDVYWARRRGLETYQDLTAEHLAVPPIRFVIWAWPSFDNDRMVLNYPRILKRSIAESRPLAWFLSSTNRERPIGVLSYSLGTQVLGGALQLSASNFGKCDICRAAFVGSVTSCRWPESANAARNVVDGLCDALIVESREDPAVKTYLSGCKRLRCNIGAPAEFGLRYIERFDSDCKIRRLDATDILHEKHQIHEFLMHEEIASPIVDQLIGRLSNPSTDDNIKNIQYETIRHFEFGNPASNPRRSMRRKKRANK